MTAKGKRGKRAEKRGYRYTVNLLKSYLLPLDPDPRFISRLGDLCRCMGADDLMVAETDAVGPRHRRGIVIGGAIFSALPFLGVAAYAVGKHLRRRAVTVGV